MRHAIQLDEWCPSCAMIVTPIQEDYGVGWTEAYGIRSHDSHMVNVCPHCKDETRPLDGDEEFDEEQ